jgi:outer membrane protein TolC
MRRCIVALATVLPLGCFSPLAAAQEVPVLRLALEDALSRAVAASHRLAEARARGTTAEASVTLRASADRPTVTALAGYTGTNHVVAYTIPGPTGPRVLYPDVPHNLRSRLEFAWPIYTGGRTDALERAARAEADAVAEEISVAQADLRLEVTRAYWAVVTANAAVDVLEQVSRVRRHTSRKSPPDRMPGSFHLTSWHPRRPRRPGHGCSPSRHATNETWRRPTWRA